MRRGLTIILVSVLAVTSLAGFWLARQSKQEALQSQSVLNAIQAELRRFEAAENATSLEMQRAIETVLHQVDRMQQPLSVAMVEQLRNGHAFLERQVSHRQYDEYPSPAGAKAFYLIARIASQFGQMGEAEAAYRESQRILEAVVARSPAPENLLGKTITDNALACLLASFGEFTEAERLLRPLAEQRQAPSQSPLSDIQQATLALLYRNLAVIAAARGGEPISLLQRSIAITTDQAVVISDSTVPDEFLADSLQVLAELRWRRGEVEEAARACHQTLATIKRLEAKARLVSSRTRHTPPSLHYDHATTMVRDNLTWLSDVRDSLAPDSSGPQDALSLRDGWLWRPLQPMTGETVPTDILLAGRLPAEFERQDALLLTWLDRPWAADVITRIVAATWQRMQVIVLVENDLLEQQARRTLQSANVDTERLSFYHLPADTIWSRDWGPLVIETAPGVVKWVDPISTGDLNFPRYRDDHAPRRLSQLLSVPVVRTPIFLHGGGILGNGSDVCLVSTSQLSWNKQLGVAEPQVTATLRRLTGAEQLIYLEPLIGEPTEHLDWFLTFTSANTVVVGEYRGQDRENAALLNRHADSLGRITTSSGPLQVERIPMPPRGEDNFGGTYTNVVYANGILLVPTWPGAEATNREALAVYRRLLPDWDVIGIDCGQLVEREGALHCATRNIFLLPRTKRGTGQATVASP